MKLKQNIRDSYTNFFIRLFLHILKLQHFLFKTINTLKHEWVLRWEEHRYENETWQTESFNQSNEADPEPAAGSEEKAAVRRRQGDIWVCLSFKWCFILTYRMRECSCRCVFSFLFVCRKSNVKWVFWTHKSSRCSQKTFAKMSHFSPHSSSRLLGSLPQRSTPITFWSILERFQVVF